MFGSNNVGSSVDKQALRTQEHKKKKTDMVDKVACYVKEQQAGSDEELLDDVPTKKEQARLLVSFNSG